MKGPVTTTPKRVPKPDLGGITPEVWITTLRDQVEALRGQVDALRKELDQAKKDISDQRKTIQTQSNLIGDLSAKFGAKITALESKAASAAKHVHAYTFSNVNSVPVSFVDGNGAAVMASVVDAKPDNGTTSQPI